jgi:hypothetical protein
MRRLSRNDCHSSAVCVQRMTHASTQELGNEGCGFVIIVNRLLRKMEDLTECTRSAYWESNPGPPAYWYSDRLQRNLHRCTIDCRRLANNTSIIDCRRLANNRWRLSPTRRSRVAPNKFLSVSIPRIPTNRILSSICSYYWHDIKCISPQTKPLLWESPCEQIRLSTIFLYHQRANRKM